MAIVRPFPVVVSNNERQSSNNNHNPWKLTCMTSNPCIVGNARGIFLSVLETGLPGGLDIGQMLVVPRVNALNGSARSSALMPPLLCSLPRSTPELPATPHQQTFVICACGLNIPKDPTRPRVEVVHVSKYCRASRLVLVVMFNLMLVVMIVQRGSGCRVHARSVYAC